MQLTNDDYIASRVEQKMINSKIEQVDDSFVQPAATQLDAIATKDEQIKALITSVQDLKNN